MPSQANFVFSKSTPAAPPGYRNVIPQIGGTDPAFISNYTTNVGGIDPRTTTTETLGIASMGNLVTFKNASAVACSLSTTSLPTFFKCKVANLGAGTVTLTPSSGQIAVGTGSLAATAQLATGQICDLFFDGTNFYLALMDLSGYALISKVQQAAYIYAPDTGGSANVYVINRTPTPTLIDGSLALFRAAHTNTGASTLAADGGSAIPITKSGTTALTGSEINANQFIIVAYDSSGPRWQMIGGGGSGGGGAAAWGSITGTLSAQTDLQAALNAKISASILTTKGDLIAGGTSGSPLRQAAGSNGQFPVYDSSQSTGIRAASLPIPCSATIPGLPSPGQIIGAFDFKGLGSVTFSGNFAGSGGSILPGGANPTLAVTCQIYKNGANIGTMTVSTSGVFGFTTSGGASVTFNDGDVVTIVAPGTADATWSGFTYTLFGNQGLPSTTGIGNPAVVWKGAYNPANPYNTYEMVSYLGGVYIALLPTTGNAPSGDTTNTTYWAFVMGFGWNDRGAYNGATSDYVKNDVVQIGGSTYKALQSVPVSTAPPNATYWEVIAAAGSVQPSDIQNQAFIAALTDTGTANAYAVALSPAITGYTAGLGFEFKAAHANTGPSTIAVNGLTAKAIVKNGSTALTGSEIAVGQIISLTYDGTNFQIVGGGSGGSSTIQTVDGTTSISSPIVLKVPNGSLSNPSAGIAQLAGTPVLLQSQNVSGVANVDFLSLITSVFDVYELVISGMVLSTTARPGVLASTNNGSSWDTSAGIYSWIIQYALPATTNGAAGSASDTEAYFRDTTITLSAAGSLSLRMRLYNPLSASRWKNMVGDEIWNDNTSGMVVCRWGATYKSATAMNALRVLTSTGTFSGLFSFYGISK